MSDDHWVVAILLAHKDELKLSMVDLDRAKQEQREHDAKVLNEAADYCHQLAMTYAAGDSNVLAEECLLLAEKDFRNLAAAKLKETKP